MLKSQDASGYVRAPRELVMSVLADFESYALWSPDITHSQVLASEGEVTIAELVWPPFGEGKLILEFVASPYEWLTFHQVDRLREDGLSGRWDLAEAEAGRHTTVNGTLSWKGGWLDVESRREVPRALGRAIDALISRCQNLEQSRGSVEAGGRRKLLEIRRRGSALDVEVGERRFTLVDAGSEGS